MWNSLSFAWQAALEMAWEAACSGSIPIGSVILDGQGRLVAAGRNRLNEPRAAGPLYLAGLPLAHAEMNALLALDYQAINPRECTLYTTTEPCPMCAGTLLMANLRHVCFGSRDPWAGSTHLYTGDTYMGSKRVRVEGPPDPLFEVALVALQVDFFLSEDVRRARPGWHRGSPFFASFRSTVPDGVALGERLNELGTLRRMREERLPAAEMLDAIAEEIEVLAGNGKR